MFDVIQYIFDTEQDTQLYFNTKNLLEDLLEQNFSMDEINQAINWFNPIVDSEIPNNSYSESKSVRSLDCIESKYLSKSIMNRIFAEEHHGKISAFQRDLLIDRLSIVAMEKDDSEIEHIFNRLLLHFNNSGFNLALNGTDKYQILCNNNFTIH